MLEQEETDTWRQYRQSRDGASRDRLFEHYKGWAELEAVKVYRQLAFTGAEVPDLHQWAYQGMLEAIERFDPDQKVAFKAFAVHRIRGTIFSALPLMSEDSSYYVKRGKHVQNQHNLTAQLDSGDNVEPVSELVALVMGMAVEFLLQEPEADLTLLTGEFYSSPEINTIAQRIRDHVDSLEEPMRSVIQLYYYEEHSFDKIAQLLEVSNSRVSQVHKKAVGVLKSRVGW